MTELQADLIEELNNWLAQEEKAELTLGDKQDWHNATH